MGNSNSNNKKDATLTASVWEYDGTESTIGGLYLSSLKMIRNDGIWDGKWDVRLYHQKSDGSRSTVFFDKLCFNPVGIEITITKDDVLTVHFMKDQNTRCNPVIWKKAEYELDSSHNIVSIKRRNDVVSAERRAIVVASDVRSYQNFSQCGPLKEPTTFSGMRHVFTVSDDSKSMYYGIKKDGEYRLNPNFPVEFGIFDIRSLKVYELSTGVYLIIIQTNSGQTYLSGYLSTNATQIFTTFQITSNLDQKQFKSFEHVSGTVFKCFFSDRTEKTFSIESNLDATITEVLDA